MIRSRVRRFMNVITSYSIHYTKLYEGNPKQKNGGLYFMKKTRLAVATKWLIDIIFFSGILVCAAVPWIIKIAGNYTFVFKEYYLQMVIVFIVAGIFADLIFFELRHMFRTILREDPFVMSNVVSLKRMGVYSFIIALCTITRLFIVITSYSIHYTKLYDQLVFIKHLKELESLQNLTVCW